MEYQFSNIHYIESEILLSTKAGLEGIVAAKSSICKLMELTVSYGIVVMR